jgi:hypothetical protein
LTHPSIYASTHGLQFFGGIGVWSQDLMLGRQALLLLKLLCQPLCIHPCILPSRHASTHYLSIHLSIHPCIHVFIHPLSMHPLSIIHPSIHPPIHHLSFSWLIHLYTCWFLHLWWFQGHMIHSLIWIHQFMNWSLEQWWMNYFSVAHWFTYLFMHVSIFLWSRFHSLIIPPTSLSTLHSFTHTFLHWSHFTDLFNPPTHLFLYLLIPSLIY